MARLRIGVLAPDFPPAVGGMEQMALGLATALAASDDVVVYTRLTRGVADPPFRQERVLSGDLTADALCLGKERVDCWLSLTAGMFPLAGTLKAPFAGYLIGNDFLDPWIGYRRWWDQLDRVPFLWRLPSPLRRLERQREIRCGIDSAERVFTLSGAVADLAKKVFPGASHKLSVVPPGVDDAFFQVRGRSASGPLRLLTVSRLTTAARRKNIDGVLQALFLLGDRLPFTYTIVGDGDDRERIEGLATTLGIRRNIQFRGFVSRDALLTAYGDADLFVLVSKASRRDIEGFGIVYLESSAAGVPVLASEEGGARDAVSHMENGLLLTLSSPEAIAHGLLQFTESRGGFPQEQVRAFAERFRWRRIASIVRGHVGRSVANYRHGTEGPSS